MKIVKLLICVVLIFAISTATMVPTSAAGRVVYYLSDLKMAEADDAESAKKLLEEADYIVLDKNLNPDGAKAVYLGYKKSTNVEDAITDVTVMNMNGGFNISDYNTIMKDALEEYSETVDNFRIAANEFADNYEAGKKEAVLAYRQLNYYYVEEPVLDDNGEPVLNEDGSEKTEQIKMGDYMLNFPATNEGFADILLKGNTRVLDNLRILLAMGVADGGALIERINAAVNDESVYEKVEHYEYAKEFADKITNLKVLLNDTMAQIDEINADTEMTDEEKEFALSFPKYTATLLMSFDAVLETIKFDDTNYSEYFNNSSDIDYSKLYPIVDAMTPGQRAISYAGQLHSVLVYNAVEMSDEELETELVAIEEEYEAVSVYLGTDMDLIEGAVGVTSDALAEESSTGNKWFACFTGNQGLDITISTLFGIGGTAIIGVASHFLKQQYAISQTTLTNLEQYTLEFNADRIAYYNFELSKGNYTQAQYDHIVQRYIEESNAINAKVTVSTSTVVLSSLGIAVGLAMIVFSIYSICEIVDSYNVEYTKIPSNMVDTVTTDSGNRYINYKVVNSLYMKGDKVKEKPGDTNGYDGEQWNAIYYTKNYEAGKCMTSTVDFPTEASDFGSYTPVHKFGADICYDLNSYNDNGNNEKIYMAFGNSNNKKAAETEVPTVVGSVFTYGAMGISGVAGIGIGMGIMGLIKRKKKDEID